MNRNELKILMTKLEEMNRLPLIELHALFPTSPALLNRDGNGRIKTITVGGVPRVRISSASKQRPIRIAEYNDNAARSKYLPVKVALKLKELGYDDEYIAAVRSVLLGDKGKGTGQILAFSDHDIDEIVRIITENVTDASMLSSKSGTTDDTSDASSKSAKSKKSTNKEDVAAKVIKLLESNAKERAMDNTTALMGIMSTVPFIAGVEAARHSNHMYSIDPWYGDSNLFSAVDDLKPLVDTPDYMQFLDGVSSQGSGHIDCEEIASNVFYGYTNISTRTLLENKLRHISADDHDGIEQAIKESKEIVKRYLIDYVTIMPTSKQTSNASASRPLATLITVATRVNQCTADNVFEKVIKGTENRSVGEQGVERLAKFSGFLTHGAFSVNQYQQIFWCSDLYEDKAPDNAKVSDIFSALDEVVSLIGE